MLVWKRDISGTHSLGMDKTNTEVCVCKPTQAYALILVAEKIPRRTLDKICYCQYAVYCFCIGRDCS